MLAVKSMDVRDNFKSLCDKVTNGQHRHISPFPDFPFGIDLCNRSYVLLSVQSEPPSTRQRVVAPKNILTK